MANPAPQAAAATIGPTTVETNYRLRPTTDDQIAMFAKL